MQYVVFLCVGAAMAWFVIKTRFADDKYRSEIDDMLKVFGKSLSELSEPQILALRDTVITSIWTMFGSAVLLAFSMIANLILAITICTFLGLLVIAFAYRRSLRLHTAKINDRQQKGNGNDQCK